MTHLLIEGDGLGLAILFMIFLAFGVPILLIIFGLALRAKHKKASKVLFIIAVVYSLIGLGLCTGIIR